MHTVRIPASRSYDVQIGAGLLPRCGEMTAALVTGRRAVIVSDDHVYPLHGAIAENSLKNVGFSVDSFVFPAGERSKNAQTYLALLSFLMEKKLTRSDVLLTLGGGVVGDLGGFAAATYLRGIACVQIPTSLLAMVDSSVGGKTAIDFGGMKNAVGCFYPPRLVLCDTDLLSTLPDHEYKNGFAEIVKYAMLFSEPFFSELEQSSDHRQLSRIIETCITMKRDLVAQDERDLGVRRLLNFGHTFGHAIEEASDGRISHGTAVAEGMRLVTAAAAAAGLCDATVCTRLCALLKNTCNPCDTVFTDETLCRLAVGDKKAGNDSISLIVPRAIGRCEIQNMPFSQLLDFLKAGAEL